MSASHEPCEDRQRPAELEAWLLFIQAQLGPVIGPPNLWKLLNYPSAGALRMAALRGSTPVPTFTLPHRRGRFAHTVDVVAWLRQVGTAPPREPKEGGDMNQP